MKTLPAGIAVALALHTAASAADPSLSAPGNYTVESAVTARAPSGAGFSGSLEGQPTLPLSVGPVAIESSEVNEQTRSGLGVTAAIPIKAVPGLDFALNAYAGHDQAGAGGQVSAAAVIVGFRLRF